MHVHNCTCTTIGDVRDSSLRSFPTFLDPDHRLELIFDISLMVSDRLLPSSTLTTRDLFCEAEMGNQFRQATLLIELFVYESNLFTYVNKSFKLMFIYRIFEFVK